VLARTRSHRLSRRKPPWASMPARLPAALQPRTVGIMITRTDAPPRSIGEAGRTPGSLAIFCRNWFRHSSIVPSFALAAKPPGLVADQPPDRYILVMQFIVPTQPKLRTSPPTGDGWIHEVKYDGWRIQVRKYLDTVALYTRSGNHCAQVPVARRCPGAATHPLLHHRR